MYINGILLGFLATIFVEMALVIVAMVIVAVTKGNKDKTKHNNTTKRI